MPTLYLIRGLPGSGKSRLGMQMQQSKLVAHCYEADQYFSNYCFETGEWSYKFDASKLSEAHWLCQKQVEFALQDALSVAVTNTSTTEKEVATYQKLAEKYNAEFVSIVLENRHGNKNVHNVPEEKLQQMQQRFSIKL